MSRSGRHVDGDEAQRRAAGNEFVPAQSKAEAVARLYAIAGVEPEPLGPGSTEKKSVLVAVASRFGISADLRSPKPNLGGQIAAALGAEWPPGSWSRGSTITLRGLNTILEAATREEARRTTTAAPEWLGAQDILATDFFPARGKLEAVNRISALTHSGPEKLGPGSKERKSVLANLAEKLGLDVQASRSKIDLGSAIAAHLGVPWTPAAWSTGQTITLVGLNTLLFGLERLLGAIGQPLDLTFASPRDEADALLVVLDDAIKTHWDGRACVQEMRDAEFTHWRQTEWVGWYFEYVGIPALVNAFGGAPRRVLNTTFDYELRSVWDLKAHSVGKDDGAILNDTASIHACLDSGSGLGFVVLMGDADYADATAFDLWHRAQRNAGPPHPRSRVLKSGFTPLSLHAYHLADRRALDDTVARGAYATMAQGRQQSGAPRPPKLKIKFGLADTPEGSLIAKRNL